VKGSPYAIIKYNSAEEAKKVIEELNGTLIDKRRLVVKIDKLEHKFEKKVTFSVKKQTDSSSIYEYESVDYASTICDSEWSFREEEVEEEMVEYAQKPEETYLSKYQAEGKALAL
jgi:RNA recognition motif-containing protein